METAKALAYAKGTAKSKYTYPGAKAKELYRTAIDKVYPKRSTWSKQCQAGASCDVAAGTVIRYSGIDNKIPRGLEEQIPWLASHPNIWKKTDIKSSADMKPGDVGVYAGNGSHIWISLGGKTTAEASHTLKQYLHISDRSYRSGSHKTWAVYRPCKASVIKTGDRGTEVKKLQEWLNWAGFACGTPDGEFGPATEKAVKTFQTRYGLDPDGIFGAKSLEIAKKIKK